MECFKTRDLLYVCGALGHEGVKSTILCANLENALFQTDRDEDFDVKTAKTVEEASKLIEVGFEFMVYASTRCADLSKVKITS